MKVLELFSGTKSIGNAFERLGYHDIVSVDSDPTYNPSRLVDIMDWDCTEFEPGTFDLYILLRHALCTAKLELEEALATLLQLTG